MKSYCISYVLTTYNKLPYLQQVLERLVAARQDDEEIVVCDGGSKDGTPVYLQELYEAGKIQQFISERDKGESHGFNKGFLRAQGEIIKLVTDDDAFCYPAIREAAVFMLDHPEIDILSGETWLISLEDLSTFTFYQWSLDHYEAWLARREPGTMIGLPWLFRRTSLPMIGLFNTGIVQVDGEMSFRFTSLDVNIAWMNKLLSIRIENPQSNARNMSQLAIDEEVERMLYFYNRSIQHNLLFYLRQKSRLVQVLKKPFVPLKQIWNRFRQERDVNAEIRHISSDYVPIPDEPPLISAFRLCDQFMVRYNADHSTEFLYPATSTN